MVRVSIAAMAALAASWSTASASPAEPLGEWAVEGNVAHVQIENCSGRLWGIVSWEKTPGAVDTNNPDPAKRSRPTLGMPILLGMAPAQANRWDGQIYNSMDGRTYEAHISLSSDDVLRVEGCVLGFLCGGQNWTRVKEATGSTIGSAKGSTTGTSIPNRSVRAQAPGTPGAQKTADLCTGLPEANTQDRRGDQYNRYNRW
jgi:uncharacterized protein (DUF2147 family)